MSGRFDGKVALISGGAGGAGLAATRAFAAAGAAVAIVDVQSAGKIAAEEIAMAGGESLFVAADVSREAEVTAAVAAVIERFGRIDILVNHAGTVIVRPFLDTTRADWERLFAINLMSMVDMTRAVLPFMLAAGGGVIVNTASISGLTASPLESAYCATKGACIQFSRAVAVEFRDRGIRCNSVCPGFIRTPHGLGELAAFEAAGMPVTEADIARMQGRICEPEEVAAAILFLAGDESGFVNGTELVIDNGAMAAT